MFATRVFARTTRSFSTAAPSSPADTIQAKLVDFAGT
jgi:hypothetical protein